MITGEGTRFDARSARFLSELQERTLSVRDLAFYNAGCNEPKGVRRITVMVRRVLRRLLRPIFFHQFALFQDLFDRLYAIELAIKDAELAIKDVRQTALAFGWDYVALVRRLAVLEDQVAALTGSTTTAATDDGEACSSILFPGLETMGTRPAEPAPAEEAHANVC